MPEDSRFRAPHAPESGAQERLDEAVRVGQCEQVPAGHDDGLDAGALAGQTP